MATPTTSGAASAAPVLRADGITLRFGGVTALSDVSIEVQHAEMLAIIGPTAKTNQIVTGLQVPVDAVFDQG